MAITTWLTDFEREQWTTVQDKDINDALQDVLKHINPDLRISEREIEISRGWFRKPDRIKLYEVYNSLGHPDYQVLNFYTNRSSINTSATKEVVLAYLYGMLSGVKNRSWNKSVCAKCGGLGYYGDGPTSFNKTACECKANINNML